MTILAWGGMPILSYPPCLFWHASPPADFHAVDKFCPRRLQPADFVVGHAGEPTGGVDHALVQVVDDDGDEAFLFQRRDVPCDAARMQAEKVGEIFVGRKTASLVVERMNLHEQDFLHERELVGKPDFLGNPDAFEVACGVFHVWHYSKNVKIPLIHRSGSQGFVGMIK